MTTGIVARVRFGPEEHPESEQGSPPVNPLLLLHRCLRGRLLLAAVLGAAMAAPLAVYGYFAVPPRYMSTGQINVAPTRPYILYENEFTERLSSFDSFVQSQANMLQSQRVLAAAAKSAALRGAGWRPLPQGLMDLTKSVSVSVPRGGQDIFVRVTWTDPRMAQAATNAVLDEYARIAIDQEASQFQTTIDTVEDLREEARQNRDDAQSRAHQLAELEGTDDLARRREAKHSEVERIEQLLLELNLRLLPFEAGGGSSAGESVDTGASSPGQLPADSLASADRDLATMLGRRIEVQLQIAALRERYGPRHRQVSGLEEELGTLQTMIDARAAIAGAAVPGAADGSLIEAQLRQQRARLEVLLRESMEEARRYGKLQLDIDRLREDAVRADEKFREADARLQSLLVQKRDGQQGRISIVQRADTPLAPSTDRRIPLAVLGAVAGGGTGVGLLVLVGVLRPRYRYIEDIEGGTPSICIMGAIPEIDADDPIAREFMAASVHQIRTAIDARLVGPADGGLVHVVTSATAGEGKSTLSLRLARSFAVSGKRTLVIDADLVGRHMTSKFGMNGSVGFADAAVDGVEPLAAVHATAESNLHVMPAGNLTEFSAERVSVSAVSHLLTALRSEFGAIVIDTGPILGSIEAQAIIPSSDEVLLVVSRGRGVRLVRLAIDRLTRLGPARLGMVFNRATLDDLERSTSISLRDQRVPERAPGSSADLTSVCSDGIGAPGTAAAN